MEIGVPELLILLFVVLLLFGPGRIVRLGGELGQSIRNFKEGLNEGKPVEEEKEQ